MKSCKTCYYSRYGKTNCLRFLDCSPPQIDLKKGVECGKNLIHWRSK